MENVRKLSHFLFSSAIVLTLGLFAISCGDDTFGEVEENVIILENEDDDGERESPFGS